jgi:disulfide oxidoreductase YuzD
MSIFCKELNKDFQNKQDMFAELKANKERIIGLKKAAIKISEPIFAVIKGEETEKSEAGTVALGDYIYPIINTTLYLDSHGDVHLNGIWDVSIKDQKNKLYYLMNHELKVGSVIGYPQDVEASVQTMPWKSLGREYDGETQALMFKVLLSDKANKEALNAILSKAPLENSVRMQYVDIEMAIDSKDKAFEQEYKNWNKYLPEIANKDVAMQAGYFWAVKQAKISKEGSAVLAGSNDATPILYTDPADAGQSNKQNPPDSSAVKISKSHLNLI